MKRALLFITIFCVSISPVVGGGKWVIAKRGSGITVYNRPVAGSPMKELKATGIINAPLEVVWEVLYDNSRWKIWFADCIEQRVIKKTSAMQKVVYHVVDVPWPIKDRDTVALVNYTKDFAKGIVVVRVRSIPALEAKKYNMEGVTSKNKRIRMPKMFSNFTAKRLGPSKKRFTYHAHAEPGVALPAWILNLFAKSQPYKTLKNLNKEAGKELYKKRAEL